MFTVIMAAKDSEKWITQTTQSLIDQSYEDWQCIISVNGSSDRTLEIAESLNDSRFSVINSEIPNKSLALNRAILRAKREWICILDADDLWHKDKLKMQATFLNPRISVDILGTQLAYINERSQRAGESPKLPLHHDSMVEWLKNDNNPVANSSVCYRKDLHDKVGYYDPELFGVEDYDIWKRCSRRGAIFSNLNEEFLLHRIHKTSSYNSATKQTYMKNLVDSIDRAYKQIEKAT